MPTRVYPVRMQGDPFLGVIGKVLGGVAKAAVNVLPGPVGAVARGVVGLVNKPKPQTVQPTLQFPQSQTSIGPGGVIYKRTEYGAQATGLPSFGGVPRQFRRRINPANVKALRRAVRRQDAFVKLARSVGMTTRCTCSGRGKLKAGKGRRR